MAYPKNAEKISREDLWNMVEEKENRKDSQLAREFIIAIPHELDENRQIQTVKDIANNLAEKGMFVDYAIHKPNKEGNDKNVHAHLLLTMRDFENGKFKLKNREWNDKIFLQNCKCEIAEIFNNDLKKIGVKPIDPRSYIEKIENGEDVPEPQKHKGVIKTNTERRNKQKLKSVQNKIKRMEELGYGEIRRGDGFDRPTNNRSVRIEKKPERNIAKRNTKNDGWSR